MDPKIFGNIIKSVTTESISEGEFHCDGERGDILVRVTKISDTHVVMRLGGRGAARELHIRKNSAKVLGEFFTKVSEVLKPDPHD